MTNNKYRTDIEQFSDTFSKKLNAEILSMIKDATKDKSPEYAQELAIHFIARFIGITLYAGLTEKLPKTLKTKKEMLDHSLNSFGSLKSRIQEAVAAAFTGAMRAYTKKDELEYYVQIKIVPPMPTRFPC